MKILRPHYIVVIVLSVMLLWSGSMLIAQDKFKLKAPNGLSFNDIKGYESWQVVAPSYRTDKNEIRFIVGNETIVNAYKQGVPQNGKPFPDGSKLVKIAYSEKKMAEFPGAIEPDVLQRVEFMIKDAKRFSDTGGWGYARFLYDAKTNAFKPYGKDAGFAQECFTCHTIVKGKDFVFTKYPQR